ncbi:MAG: hypothetical protein CM1200mP40_12020 [Gammaproteobacteria bacterium]|nr:MAG: hypothetical protein CM1200mP40_12020 [Gammaproteobacteria bacterium]
MVDRACYEDGAIDCCDSSSEARARRRKGSSKVVYLSPQGRLIQHDDVVELATRQSMVLVCGRYQGIDNRVIESEIDEEISIGDFVLSGGELAAMALIDAMIRFQPGVLGDEDSVQQDSFTNGCCTVLSTPGRRNMRPGST